MTTNTCKRSHGASRDYYVTYNNIDGAINATNHLINHGHREIAVIAGHPNSFPTHERMKGFISAIKNAGLSVRDEYVCYGDWEYQSGYDLIKKLLSLPNRPTAVFAMNDVMAAGCINSAHESGLSIPEELSIIGFDNREIASYLQVPLTTIQLPNKEIGQESAKMLVALAQGNTVDQNCLILPCTLIERASVATAAS